MTQNRTNANSNLNNITNKNTLNNPKIKQPPNTNPSHKQKKRRPRKQTPERDPAEKLPQNDPQIPEDIIWRKFIEKAVTQLCFKLIENTSVSQKFLNFAAQLLQKRHFDDVTEDRSSSDICGHPCCSQSLPKSINKQPKYVVDLKEQKLVDNEYRKRFCSFECYNAAQNYRHRLSEIPSYARDCVAFLKLLYPSLTDEQIDSMHQPIRVNPTMQSYIQERSGYNDDASGPIPKHIAEAKVKEKNQKASAIAPLSSSSSSSSSSSDLDKMNHFEQNNQKSMTNKTFEKDHVEENSDKQDDEKNDFSSGGGGIEGYVPQSDKHLLNHRINHQQQRQREKIIQEQNEKQQKQKLKQSAEQLKSQISALNKTKYRRQHSKTMLGTSHVYNDNSIGSSKNFVFNYNLANDDNDNNTIPNEENEENEDNNNNNNNNNNTQLEEKYSQQQQNSNSISSQTQIKEEEEEENQQKQEQKEKQPEENVSEISNAVQDLHINDENKNDNQSRDYRQNNKSEQISMKHESSSNVNTTPEYDDSELWDAYSPVESSEDESEDESTSFFEPPSKQSLHYNSVLSSFGSILMAVQRWHTNHTALHLNPRSLSSPSSSSCSVDNHGIRDNTADMGDYYDLYAKHGIHIPHEEQQNAKKQNAERNLASEPKQHHPMEEQRMKHLMEMLEQRIHIIITELSLSSVTTSFLLREIFSLISTFSLHQAIPGFNSSQWKVVSLLCIHLVAIREPKLDAELNHTQDGVLKLLEQSDCTKEQFDSLISTLTQFY